MSDESKALPPVDGRVTRRVLAAVLLSASLLCVPAPGARAGRSLTIDVTARREVFVRRIGRGLLLRVVKERSANRAHFGWRLEVVRAPYRPDSPNLLYQNPEGHGADPSQVYAWHVAERHFPDERELKVRGYPYVVRAVLSAPRVEGRGPEAGFVSGRLTVSWGRRP